MWSTIKYLSCPALCRDRIKEGDDTRGSQNKQLWENSVTSNTWSKNKVQIQIFSKNSKFPKQWKSPDSEYWMDCGYCFICEAGIFSILGHLSIHQMRLLLSALITQSSCFSCSVIVHSGTLDQSSISSLSQLTCHSTHNHLTVNSIVASELLYTGVIQIVAHKSW